MDNNKNLFEGLLKADGIDPANTTESERIVFRQMLDKQSKSKQSKPSIARPNIWRIIMKNKITKFAIAAVIIAAVFIGIHYSGGSIDGANIALAQVVEGVKKMPWLHQIANGVIEGKKVAVEAWISFDKEIIATKQPEGYIEYYNFIEHKGYHYDPCSHTISVSHVGKSGYSPFQRITSPTYFFDAMSQNLIEQNGQLLEKIGTYDGNVVKIYEISFSEHPIFKNAHLVFFVDPKQNLIIGEHVKETDKYGNILIDIQMKLNYPPKGPDSIYDMGVPTSAKKIGLEREKTEFDKLLERIDSLENWPEPRALVVAYWKARTAKDYDEMAKFWPGSATWNHKLQNEPSIEYVFGEVQATEFEGNIIVPYAAKSYYENYGKYNLKMRLSNKKSARQRYYITSGN